MESSIAESNPGEAEPELVDHCDVCIVGAGIAGLNAAAVASQYLSREQKIVLIDRRNRPGGMWVDTYPYVRLHQPHSLFTAGNIEWTLGRDRSYLATQPEVLDHFAYCLDVIRRRVRVVEYFGWAVDGHIETETGNRISAKSSSGQRLAISADRVIWARGLDINPKEPLSVSSERVHSVSPNSFDMRSRAMRGSSAPIWIVGGGKTAMDTAYVAVTEYPGREVNVIAGSGTYFIDRERLLSAGARRLWQDRYRPACSTILRFDSTARMKTKSENGFNRPTDFNRFDRRGNCSTPCSRNRRPTQSRPESVKSTWSISSMRSTDPTASNCVTAAGEQEQFDLGAGW